MPEIPTYFPTEQKTALPDPFQSANATPEMFGAEKARLMTSAITSGVSIVANVMDDINKRKEEDRIKLAKARARDTLTQAERRIDDMMFGDNGFYTRRGEQVENVIEDAQKEFEKIRRESMGKLQDDYSKELFSPSYDDFVTRNLRSLSQHRANEIDKYNMATLDAQIAQDHDNAVKNRYNPENLDNKSKEIIINTMSKYAGMGEEVQTQAVEDALNLLHKDVILGYMDDREFNTAKGYIDRFGDEIDETVKRDLNRIIKEENDNAYVDRKADEISKSGKTIEEQLDAVNKEKRPEIKENLKKEVLQRFDLKNKINDYRQTQTAIDEWNKLFDMFDSGNLEGLTQYKPPTGKVDPGVNDALRRWKDNKLKDILDPKTKEHTLDYFKFLAMPDVDKGKLTFDQMMGYQNKVNPKDFEEIFKAWETIRNAPDKIKNIQTPTTFFDNAIKGRDDFTITKNMRESKKDEVKELAQRYHVQADRYYNLLPEDKKYDMDAWDKIVNFLMRKIYPHGNRRFRPDKQIYRFELPYQDDIPDPGIFLQEENLPPKIKAFVDDGQPVTNEYDENLELFVYKVDLGTGFYDLYNEAEVLIGRFPYGK